MTRRLRAIKLSYVVFAWPSLVVAVAWRRSTTRQGLVELRDELREVQREPERTGTPGVVRLRLAFDAGRGQVVTDLAWDRDPPP